MALPIRRPIDALSGAGHLRDGPASSRCARVLGVRGRSASGRPPLNAAPSNHFSGTGFKALSSRQGDFRFLDNLAQSRRNFLRGAQHNFRLRTTLSISRVRVNGFALRGLRRSDDGPASVVPFRSISLFTSHQMLHFGEEVCSAALPPYFSRISGARKISSDGLGGLNVTLSPPGK